MGSKKDGTILIMSGYFDKTFFKFALGFVTIIAVSIFLFIAVSYIENGRAENHSAQTISHDGL